MRRHERGQSIVEYLAVSLTVILAILGLAGPIQAVANRLMDKTEHQLIRTDHGTVDAFLPP